MRLASEQELLRERCARVRAPETFEGGVAIRQANARAVLAMHCVLREDHWQLADKVALLS